MFLAGESTARNGVRIGIRAMHGADTGVNRYSGIPGAAPKERAAEDIPEKAFRETAYQAGWATEAPTLALAAGVDSRQPKTSRKKGG